MNDIEKLAALLRERNRIDRYIKEIIDKPALSGHIGEGIASQVFPIQLNKAANNEEGVKEE